MANEPLTGTSWALDDIKAVDFGWVAAEPLTMRYLAHQGATVIRLESHTHLETLRTSGPYRGGLVGVDSGGQFANVNSGKYGVSLNLAKPKGRELAFRLILWSDIVGEGFSPGQMKKWGLDYYTVSRIKPDIIYFSTSQQGQTGPRGSVAGYGNQLAPLSGIHHVSGWPDKDPSAPYGAYIDYVCPRFAVAAIMAAIDYRRRTGKGVYLDQSQFETGLQFFSPPIMDFLVNRRVMGRSGNRLPCAAPHGVFPCKGMDRWVAIAVFTDQEWQALRKVMGVLVWMNDVRFSTIKARKANQDELDKLMAEWTLNYEAERVETMIQAEGVAANVVESIKDLFEDRQLKHRGHLQYLEHPVIGWHAYESPAFRLSETSFKMFHAPSLGEHNEFVYKNILDLSDDEISDLLVEGVITTEADLPNWTPTS